MKRKLTTIFFIITFISTFLLINKCYAVTGNNTTNSATSNNTINSNQTTNSVANSTKAANNTTTNTTTKSTTKSSNANLTTLGITPKQYDFSGFSKDKTSYNVTIPSNVYSLKVSYKTADSKATVKVSGNNDLNVGTNIIKVVVTAENGKTKTYTIKVTKLATEEEKPGNVIYEDDNKLDLYLTSLSIQGLELEPEFKSNVYSYEASTNKSNLTKVNVEAKANNENATIEITGNEDIVEGENLINIVVKSSNSSTQTVYQVTVNKTSTNTVGHTKLLEKIKNNWKPYMFVTISVLAFIIAFILLIKLFIKDKKESENNDMYERDNDDEYDVYKNDINEFSESEPDNFIEKLYRQRNDSLYNEEELTQQEKETLEEINKQTDDIFRDKTKGQSVEYNNEERFDEDPLEKRTKRRGKHF